MSTIDALIEMVNDILEDLERRDHVALILCDLPKAFNCVDHNTILGKLEKIGIRGLPLSLSILIIKSPTVCYSDFTLSRYGVPQGSVLGPILFIVYDTDFFEYLCPVHCHIIADDASMITSSKKMEALLEASDIILNDTSNWFLCNSLHLNKDKTQKLFFSKSSDLKVLKRESSKIRGETFDDNLSWAPHVNNLIKLLSKNVYAFRHLRNILPLDALRSVYFTLVHSSLNYGIILW